MNNGAKVVVGSLLGAGVGFAISKLAERDSAPVAGVAETEPRESLKNRWQRAKLAGEEARAAKEAELRAYFRAKVNDPTALRDDVTS
jgi:hypothetical protein